jgi:hypothetical protein
MKKEIDFSRGVRGKYVGKNIRIVGTAKAEKGKPKLLTERELLQRRIAELEGLVEKYQAERAQILALLASETLAD